MTTQRSSSEEESREMDARQGKADSGDQRGAEHAGGVQCPEGLAEHAASPSPRSSALRAPVPPLSRSRTTRRTERKDVTVRAARVKAASRIEEVVRSYGVELTPVGGGRRLLGLCPFHSEEHASFTVYPETRSFFCYGCHAAGDVIAFVRLIKSVGFDEALRLLGECQKPERVSRIEHRIRGVPRDTLSLAGENDITTDQGRLLLSVVPRPALIAQPASLASQRQEFREAIREPSICPDGQGERPEGADITQLVVLSATTALAMEGLARAAGPDIPRRAGHLVRPRTPLPPRIPGGRSPR
jgi:hypothetical protein